MPVPFIQKILTKEIPNVFGNVSHDNQFQVSFGSLTSEVVGHIQSKYNIPDVSRYIQEKGGILCSNANLPATSLATVDVRDNFMGIPQEFAHTRLYTDIDFTFYVSNDYTNLRIFEGWIDYISGGSETKGPFGDGRSENEKYYYRRMRYPDSYKCDTMYITKFEKNYNFDKEIGSRMDYQFISAFPKLIAAVPVKYGEAQILRVTVSFNYDRYIVDPVTTIDYGNSNRFASASEQFFGDNRESLLNDTGGSNFIFDPSRFGGGSIIQDPNSNLA